MDVENPSQEKSSEESLIQAVSPDSSGTFVLKDRDIQILKLIHEQRYLAQSHLKLAFWRESSDLANTCYHRMTRLTEARYITTQYSVSKKIHVHLITEKALVELRSRNLDSGLSLYEPRDTWESYLDHNFKLSTIRINLESFGFTHWVPERVFRELIRPPQIPDGAATLHRQKIAIELENDLSKGTMRYKKMFYDYKYARDYVLVLMIVDKLNIPDWIKKLDYDDRQLYFARYKDLVHEGVGKSTRFENKRDQFVLEEIL